MAERVVDGAALREARFLAGMSQKTFAAKIGISFQALSFIERGANGMAPENLKKAAKILGVPVIELTKIEDEEVPA